LASTALDVSGAVVYATVLYWHERELTLVERCVDSLLCQDASAVDLRIVVVDNGCGQNPRLPVRPDIECMHLAENLGFAGGHNAAMRAALAAGADYVYLVNSDVVVDRGCVATLIRTAQQWPSVGLLGPLVLREQAPNRIESTGQTFNVWTGRHRELGRGLEETQVDPTPRQVDAASGCALLATRAVLEQVGFLDEGLFAYFEDMDWCLRARMAGFEVRVVPQARVWHRGAGSTGGPSPLTTFYSVRNHLIVARRHGRRAARWAFPPLVIAYHLGFVMGNRERRTMAHLRAVGRGAFAALRKRMGAQAELAGSY